MKYVAIALVLMVASLFGLPGQASAASTATVSATVQIQQPVAMAGSASPTRVNYGIALPIVAQILLSVLLFRTYLLNLLRGMSSYSVSFHFALKA